LPGAKFTLRPSLALSYIGSVTAWHSSSRHQPNFVALSRGCHLYLAGWPSRWALAHILVAIVLVSVSLIVSAESIDIDVCVTFASIVNKPGSSAQ